jgi:hypothetical protein
MPSGSGGLLNFPLNLWLQYRTSGFFCKPQKMFRDLLSCDDVNFHPLQQELRACSTGSVPKVFGSEGVPQKAAVNPGPSSIARYRAMPSQEMKDYLQSLGNKITLDLYIPRRFNTATVEGGADPDPAYKWGGVFREGEPGLGEILKHPRVVVLGEPGAGKSLVARAAVQDILRENERVPVFTELKQYRGDLRSLLEVAAPRSILDQTVSSDRAVVRRTYILDGVDEIPPGIP